MKLSKIINPSYYKKMLISGYNNLYNNYLVIDKLNVFPVPDGDTGTNLNLTIFNAIESFNELKKDYSFFELSNLFARGLMMSARGNSGVIFSQIFRGMSNTFTKQTRAIDFNLLKKMFFNAKELSYKSVMKPVEGTILTVIKDMSNSFNDISLKDQKEINKVFKHILKIGNTSLENTINLLPKLKEYGVIDSGACGLIRFLEGMQYFLDNEKEVKKDENIKINKPLNSILSKEKLFGYCTQVLVTVKDELKDKLNIDVIKEALIEQDSNNKSLVTILDFNMLKIHIHTLYPGNILTYLQNFGVFKTVKIDNMTEQVNENKISYLKEDIIDFENLKEIDILAVVSTNELANYFKKELNIQNIIVGGEKLNPSVEEFIKAIENVDAKCVIILPNNSNSILSAQNALKYIKSYSKKTGAVIHTKSIQEGLALSLKLDPSESNRKNINNLKSELSSIQWFSIYLSKKSGKSNSIYVNKGDYVAYSKSKLIAKNKNALSLLKKILNWYISKNSEIVTIIRGKNTSDYDIMEISKYLDENYDVEYEFISSNQEKNNYSVLVE